MNFTQILTLVLQAFLVRTASFAVTLGVRHFLITITQTGTPGNSGSFVAILGVLGQIMAGQAGTFHIGVFTLTIQELAPV